jgi:hypothetical protein
MAVLTKAEKRKAMASKHASREWVCSLCGAVCKGNGGATAHQNMHLRRAGLPKGDWLYLLKHRELAG